MKLPVEELAQSYPQTFLRGVNMGKFVAILHMNKPLSDRPLYDALDDATKACSVMLLTSAPEDLNEIDALFQGCIESVRLSFTQQEEGV